MEEVALEATEVPAEEPATDQPMEEPTEAPAAEEPARQRPFAAGF
ncbi:MAG: hypothetical protein ACK2UK_18705 [Candidatus Promineifilaceae bacterium]